MHAQMDSKVAYVTEHMRRDLLYLQHGNIQGGENAGLERELAILVKSTNLCVAPQRIQISCLHSVSPWIHISD